MLWGAACISRITGRMVYEKEGEIYIEKYFKSVWVAFSVVRIMGKAIYIICFLLIYYGFSFYFQRKRVKRKNRFSFLDCAAGLLFTNAVLIALLNSAFLSIIEYSGCVYVNMAIVSIYLLYFEIIINGKTDDIGH